MQKIDTTIVGQGLGPKYNRKISWSLRHRSECYPWVGIHCNRRNHTLTILGASLRASFTNNSRRIQDNNMISSKNGNLRSAAIIVQEHRINNAHTSEAIHT